MTDLEATGDLLERWRRTGDQAAANQLYNRFAESLCRLAERHMDQRLQQRVGGDDVIQSAFRTFFRRTAEGQYSLDDPGSVWNLLVTITLNKVRRQGERHRAGKRDIGVERSLDSSRIHPEALSRDPSPEHAVTMIDELRNLFDVLSESERELIRLELEGYTSAEIAERLGCSRWTVRRVHNRVFERMRSRVDQQPPE